VRSHEILPGDKYLLCSDGVSSLLTHHEINEVLGAARAPVDIVAQIVGYASSAPDRDNLTAVAIGCDLAPGSNPAHRPRPPSSPRTTTGVRGPEVLMPARFAPPTDPDPRFSLVPGESASVGLLDSKGHLVDAFKTLISPGVRRRVAGECVHCHESIDETAHFCPLCGAKQSH
jgi:hypothetical protein